MKSQKYTVNQYLLENILNWVKSGEIAIPEIQRPFVWDSARVRDLMDSLYQGYPIGYVIAWRNPDIRTKDGKISAGKKILIDGQQRVTAMRAAILGEDVLDKNYQKKRIQISFHPLQERFEVFNSAINKDAQWIADISDVLNGSVSLLQLHRSYVEKNQNTDPLVLERNLGSLLDILKRQIGMIELEHDLDIEIVTEIFIRINSKGIALSQADFAMSKIASETRYNGHILRKAIDYFCHMVANPEIYNQVVANDEEFKKTEFFNAIAWIHKEKDDLYKPSYLDVMRVAFTTEFSRGKLSDLVALLSGRNFETRTYEESIAQETFERFGRSFLRLSKKTDFQRFIMIIRSAGFIHSSMIRSINALNFAYIVYLKLRDKKYAPQDIEKHVRRWYVLSILTERASGSFESRFESDIKSIDSLPFEEFLQTIESGELSDAFWKVALVEALKSSSTNSPVFWVYIVSQIKSGDHGFLSRDIKVENLISARGDIHHIFPQHYLKSMNFNRSEYNQIANMVYMQTEINIQIGSQSPDVYFNDVKNQIETKLMKYGNIDNMDMLQSNLKQHCLPDTVMNMTSDNYDDFLSLRRKLMAEKIRQYYDSL